MWKVIQNNNKDILNISTDEPIIDLTYNSYHKLLNILNDLLKEECINITNIIIDYLHSYSIPIELIGGICKKHKDIESKIFSLQEGIGCTFGVSGGTSSYKIYVRLSQSRETGKIYGEVMAAFISTNFVQITRNKQKREYVGIKTYTILPTENIIFGKSDYPKGLTLNELIWSNWNINSYALQSIKEKKYFVLFFICQTSIGNAVEVSHCDKNGTIIDTNQLVDPNDWQSPSLT